MTCPEWIGLGTIAWRVWFVQGHLKVYNEAQSALGRGEPFASQVETLDAVLADLRAAAAIEADSAGEGIHPSSPNDGPSPAPSPSPGLPAIVGELASVLYTNWPAVPAEYVEPNRNDAEECDACLAIGGICDFHAGQVSGAARITEALQWVVEEPDRLFAAKSGAASSWRSWRPRPKDLGAGDSASQSVAGGGSGHGATDRPARAHRFDGREGSIQHAPAAGPRTPREGPSPTSTPGADG